MTQTVADELLRGAVDLHVHCYPELGLDFPHRQDALEMLESARAVGLRAMVLKSVTFPTAALAHYLNSSGLGAGVQIVGSITLNHPVGGLNPLAVEVAAAQGAKMVWFPHWSAENDMRHGGFYEHTMKRLFRRVPTDGIRILTDSGTLRPEAWAILEVIRDRGLALATGHISPTESLVLIREARRLGIEAIFTHPFHGMINAGLEVQREAAAMGAFIEHCFIGLMPMHWRIEPRVVADAIRAVGPEHVVICSDAFRNFNPPQAEFFRMAVATLLELQFSPAEIAMMIRTNPVRILHWD